MTLPQRRYGDPLQVMLRAEAETCRGCVHSKVDRDGVNRCRNPNRAEVLAEKRCDDYEETTR